MGSTSDWDVMSDAAATLAQFGVEFEKRVVSAHRTPDLLVEYAKTAKSRGLEVIIAGAGGAAHLPGMVASMTALPVIGVPALLVLTISSVPSSFSTSQVQPEPKLPTALFVKASAKAS